MAARQAAGSPPCATQSSTSRWRSAARRAASPRPTQLAMPYMPKVPALAAASRQPPHSGMVGLGAQPRVTAPRPATSASVRRVSGIAREDGVGVVGVSTASEERWGRGIYKRLGTRYGVARRPWAATAQMPHFNGHRPVHLGNIGPGRTRVEAPQRCGRRRRADPRPDPNEHCSLALKSLRRRIPAISSTVTGSAGWATSTATTGTQTRIITKATSWTEGWTAEIRGAEARSVRRT